MARAAAPDQALLGRPGERLREAAPRLKMREGRLRPSGGDPLRIARRRQARSCPYRYRVQLKSMEFIDLIPGIDVLTALDPDELGLRLLPWIALFPSGNRQIEWALREAAEAFPGRGRELGFMAIREAWAWLEGAALLIPSPALGSYKNPHSHRNVRARRPRRGRRDYDTRQPSPAHYRGACRRASSPLP